MKHIYRILIACIWLALCTCNFAQSEKKRLIDTEIKQLHVEMKNIGHDVEIIRRDQINYKIEKDLLKDAYASNIQTINMVITIVLGVLGVLGYLGIRSVKEIRTDYAVELEKLRTMKTQLESEIESVRSKQKEVEGQVGNLTKTNEDQDRRLKVMELIEKISNLIGDKQWGWALKYVDIGLGLDAQNGILLSQKGACHAKLGELTAAIEAVKKVLELEPENTSQKANLLEFLAISNQRDEFNYFYENFVGAIEHLRNGALVIYLKAMHLIMSGDLDSVRSILQEYFAKQAPEPKAHLDPWSFDEVKTIISTLPAGEQRNLANAMIAVFDGKSSPIEFLQILSGEKV